MDDLFDYGKKQQQPAAETPASGEVFRVVHTADWHLGKTLGDLPREEEHERFLAFLLRMLIDEAADLLIIAGDVFDSANPPQSAQRQYFDFLSKLRRTSACRVLVVAGNHDSPTGLDAPKELLGALDIDVVGAAPADPADAVFLYPDSRQPVLAVAAVPFLRDRDLRSSTAGESRADIEKALADGIGEHYESAAQAVEKAAPGVPAIATGHLTVKGATASDSEREIHIGGLGAVGDDRFPARFSYVALGHLHRPQRCDREGRVRYSGSPIALSFSEAGDAKSVRVIDIAGGAITAQRALPVPLARPLVRLEVADEGVGAAVAGFEPPTAPLPTWVELVVDGPLLGEDVVAVAAAAAEGRGFEIVRVIARGASSPALRSADLPPGTAGYDDLLEHPEKVFARRLDAEPSLDAGEREALELAFLTLLEQQRETGR